MINRLCTRVPSSVQPDHFTILGIAGGVVVFAGITALTLAAVSTTVASRGALQNQLLSGD